MRILLAYRAHPAGSRDPFASLLPVGLLSLRGVLVEQGHDTRLANLSGFSWDEVTTCLRQEHPELLGLSQFTHNRHEMVRLAVLAKSLNPSCIVVFGGPHASHAVADLLKPGSPVDLVVIGEGEATIRELATVLGSKGRNGLRQVQGIAFRAGGEIVTTPPRPPIKDLDTLPRMAEQCSGAIGVDPLRQLGFIVTSRGCPAACSFCNSPRFWGNRLRFRSPRAIVDEIRFIRDRFGLVYFSLRDDTFTADRGRVLEFCRLLVEERVHILWNCQSRANFLDEELLVRLKLAGCECVQVGVESGAPSLLKKLGKGLIPEQMVQVGDAVRRVGLQLSIYLITGIPGEGETELRETCRLIERLRPHDGHVSPLAYYPGTGLFEQAVARGEVPETLFADSRGEACLVRNDPFVQRATATLLDAVTAAGERHAYRPRDFQAQKKRYGLSSVTNVLAGAYFEAAGEARRAEAEYRELIRHQADNPWGWLLLGELLGSTGRFSEAEQAFDRVLGLVPRHAPAHAARGELAKLAGRKDLAREWFARALAIDPREPAALHGLKQLDKKKAKPRAASPGALDKS